MIGATVCTRRASKTQWKALIAESEILRDRLIVAVSACEIDAHEIIGIEEEHVLRLIELLETRSIVREAVTGISSRCVAEEDALNLVGIVLCHSVVCQCRFCEAQMKPEIHTVDNLS